MAEPKSSQSPSLPLHTNDGGGEVSPRRKGILRRLLPAFACPPFRGASSKPTTPLPPATRPADRKKDSAAPPESYDTLGSELAENARIWHFFRTNVTAYDQTVTIHEWNETLDVLLVFAALFLGAVTSFVIQTYPALSGDDSDAAPVLIAVAVGLFFCSLVVSLAVSLLCILAKQWLQEYIRRLTEPAEPARYWAQRRWIYELGMKEWEIAFLCTDGLPLMLHLALFLFAVGLVLLLCTLRQWIAWLVGAITVLVAFVYFGCTVAPIFSVNAPTATPLLLRQYGAAPRREVGAARQDGRWARLRALILDWRVLSYRFTTPWADREWNYIDEHKEAVELSTLKWLLTVSRAEGSLEVAFSAVSALPLDSEALEFVRSTGIGLADAIQTMHGDKLRGIDVMRVIRSELHVRPGDWKRPRLGLDVPQEMLKRLSEVESADAQLLHAVMQKAVDFSSLAEGAREWRDMESPSLLGTIRLLLRSKNIEARAVFYLMLPLHPGDIREMRSDFAALALEEKMRAERDRKRLLKPGSSPTETHDGDMRHASGEAPPQPPTIQSPGGIQAAPAAQELSPGQRREQDSAAALVSLAEVTTKFACNCSELSLAAQLAVRIAAPIKDGLPTLISSVSWQDPLDMIQPRAPEMFAAFRSRDPILGWCRTQGRLLHAIISEWCLLDPTESDAEHKPPNRVMLGRRAEFVLQSLLDAHENLEFSALVRATITSLLLITFLDTTRPLDIALADHPPLGFKISSSEIANEGPRTTPKRIQPTKVAWSSIRKLALSHSTLLRLAVVLSGALCSALRRRDGPQDHGTLVSVFFASDCLATLLGDSSRVERLIPSKVYVHLAQHCAELEGDWFLTMGAGSSPSGAAKQSLGLDVLAGWVKGWRERARTGAQVSGASAGAGLNLSGWTVDRVRLRGFIRCFFAAKLKDEVDKVGPCTSCAGSPQYLKWIRSGPPSDLVLKLGTSSSTAAPHEYHLTPVGQATS